MTHYSKFANSQLVTIFDYLLHLPSDSMLQEMHGMRPAASMTTHPENN